MTAGDRPPRTSSGSTARAEGDAAALQGLTLRVAPGEGSSCSARAGPGKSTLLRVLAGLSRRRRAASSVLGADLGAPRRAGARRSAQRHVGLVDQHHDRALPPDLRCADVVGLPLALRGAPRAQRAARAGELLERVGLGDRARRRPRRALRRRAPARRGLRRAGPPPGLLLADEPGGELDAAAAPQAVYALIAELARERATTVVLVSHDPAAGEAADRTLRLRDGRITARRRRRGGEEAIVVGRGGWMRLPEELLRAAGIGGARCALARGPAPSSSERRPTRRPAPTPSARRRRPAGGPRPGVPACRRAPRRRQGLRRAGGARGPFDARFPRAA